MVDETGRFGWAAVIAAMIGVGLAVGLFFGLLSSAGLIPSGVMPVFIGLACGIAAPILIWRMRTARQ